ncbi:cytosine permease [Dehalococcoides mccartyi]|uniref:cytosine permease n=1 Tax=Dehalococcoides mccartyi TaxID=61435 RepID=UPI0009902DE7|nr:cytosine permease [Dehalococcoides mccartyi]AQU02713.1 cytosine permease [Dehalococcoides mccartyi]AQU04048.1 cytosine permease [Dehalococcoides mccartyi]
MSYLPQQYYGYYPAQYQPQFWQALVAGVIDIVIIIALGAWALSLVKKAMKGEEVELR